MLDRVKYQVYAVTQRQQHYSERFYMPGTMTAPAWTATATSRLATLHLIDASGDLFTDALTVPVAATAAQLNAWQSAYQAASNASIWKTSDETIREGDADPDEALALYRATIAEGVNMLFKNIALGQTVTPRLIAPVEEAMQGNQDIPLLSSTELTNVITALLALLPSYDFKQAQFTGRRERKNNPRIK